MQVGRLNKRFAIQKPTLALDGAGVPSTVWEGVAYVWGHLVLLSESLKNKQDNQTGTHAITLRYREDIATGDRLALGSRVFFVRGLFDKEGTGRWLQLIVEEETRLR